MHTALITVGERPPEWINTGFNTYCSRLPPAWRLQLIEIAAAKRRAKNNHVRTLVKQEGERILAKLSHGVHAVELAVQGQQWTTEQLAKQLSGWLQDGRDIAFIIGGPDGLDAQVSARCETHWSLSPLTFPHALVRVLVAEQLYRAWSIIGAHPYHRA